MRWAGIRGEYGRAITWLARQVTKLAIDVQLETEATVEAILAEHPDAVIVATGATPRLPTFPSADGVPVLSEDDVLRRRVNPAPGQRCVVIDEDAHMRGPGSAETLLVAGAALEIVTKEQTVCLDIDPTLKPALYRRLFEKGVVMTPLTGAVSVADGAVQVAHVYSGKRRALPADLVVLALGGEARADLYQALRAAEPALEVQRFGDC